MAIISRQYMGDPEIGPLLLTGRCRVLLGWSHTDDSYQGLMRGKIWCCVSKTGLGDRVNEKFQVFDQNFNRSQRPGEVRDCGVANFTMVRMFHRFWASSGSVPRDMNSADKLRCRQRYHMLIRKDRISRGLPVDDGPDVPLFPSRSARRGRTRRTRNEAFGNLGTVEIVKGGSPENPMVLEDEEEEGDLISDIGGSNGEDFRDSGIGSGSETDPVMLSGTENYELKEEMPGAVGVSPKIT